jgi:hypothetical protein
MTQAWHAFLDDAALFPPARMPLPQAVKAHLEHRAAWYADVVGPFVCPASAVSEMAGHPVGLSLTLPDGPVGLALAASSPQLTAVEVRLPDSMAASQALRMLDSELPEAVTGYLEVPRARPDEVLDALAGTRYRAKFRTGGTDPQDHPGERELAHALLGAVRRGVAFKCTAGLHHAVRHTDGQLEQHGFLNVLLAVDAARQGADLREVAEVLAVRSAEDIAGRMRAAGPRLDAARELFVSVGTCSIAEPVADLVSLGLLGPGPG